MCKFCRICGSEYRPVDADWRSMCRFSFAASDVRHTFPIIYRMLLRQMLSLLIGPCFNPVAVFVQAFEKEFLINHPVE